MTIVRLSLCSLALLWLAGCVTSPGGGESGVPSVDSNIDLSSIPPAIPRDEPLSDYGNPDSYTVFGKTYYPMQHAEDFVQIGTASWYGRQFQGQRTSSGETYNMYRMTAAHKTLPLPSYVRVTNLRNEKQVIVRVNDRGPFHGDRIIDLSYVAALKLGIAKTGTAPVAVETVTADDVDDASNGQAHTAAYAGNTEPDLPDLYPLTPTVKQSASPTTGDAGVYLQVGAFSRHNNARQLSVRLRDMGIENIVTLPLQRNGATLYRVRIGPFSGPGRLRSVRRTLIRYDISSFTVRQRSLR